MRGGKAGHADERAQLEQEVARLAAKLRELGQVDGEFEHDARRLQDALERLGGRSSELEGRLRILAKNRKLTARDIAATETALQDRRRRLAALDGGR